MYYYLISLYNYFLLSFFFFFNDTATTEIYTLSLHDALPIFFFPIQRPANHGRPLQKPTTHRSEEHTSELQSPDHLVCRLLLEKKKKTLHKKTQSYYSLTQIYICDRLHNRDHTHHTNSNITCT